jgi:branched-chain amino acid transport system ATP-binding protein
VTALLDIDGLTGGYTKATILRDVTLHVDAGEIVALFGANGAGKTTLLKAVSGVLPVCRGAVRLAGRPIDRQTPWARARLGLAHVPEGRHVFAAMTVRENLETAARAVRAPKTLPEVYDLFPRLEERARQRAGTLSGGEQQMLAVARALISNPKVMLVDEMSAGLAPVIAERLVDALATIRDQGVAILLVEQAPHLVADTITRAYLLDRGRVTHSGTMGDLGGASKIAELYLGVS